MQIISNKYQNKKESTIQNFINQMLKLSLVLAGTLMISNYSLSQSRLAIEINEFRNDKGVLMLQLFDENHKVIAQEKVFIKYKKCSVNFLDLPSGKYGVRFFHDENLSGKMETNFVGKPIEGYGFSNNVTGKFGPPPFDKWLFVINLDKKIAMKPIY